MMAGETAAMLAGSNKVQLATINCDGTMRPTQRGQMETIRSARYGAKGEDGSRRVNFHTVSIRSAAVLHGTGLF